MLKIINSVQAYMAWWPQEHVNKIESTGTIFSATGVYFEKQCILSDAWVYQ